MVRYIDADKMQDFLAETNSIDDWLVSQYNADRISSFIESQPTADVVEVVRCKDCEHRETFGCPMYTEEIVRWDDDGYFEHEILVSDHSTDTGFCSYGKRKEGEKR